MCHWDKGSAEWAPFGGESDYGIPATLAVIRTRAVRCAPSVLSEPSTNHDAMVSHTARLP